MKHRQEYEEKRECYLQERRNRENTMKHDELQGTKNAYREKAMLG